MSIKHKGVNDCIVLTNIKIRKVEKSESKILLAIAKETFIEAFADQNTKEDMQAYLKENFSVFQIEDELKDKNSQFYFADYRGQILGYLKVNQKEAQTESVDFDGLEIERIYVLKDYYGSGVGKLLFDKSVSIAIKNELSWLWLGVWNQNPRAIKFYEKQGFEVFGTHGFVLGSAQQTDLLMKLLLKNLRK